VSVPRSVRHVADPDLTPVTRPTPELHGRLASADIEAVRELVDQVTEADGTAPLSEHVLLHLPRGGDEQVRNALVREDGRVLAYAHLDITDPVDGSSAELAVAPGARGRGLGRALVEALLAESPDGRLRLWAHGDAEPAAGLAAAMGFRRSRVLFQMRRPLSTPLPPVVLPDGVTLRTFQVGRDEKAWTELNNLAFADHPDQGGWGLDEIELRENEPWFDPQGFFLAERDGRLVGSHWTKVHGGHGGDEPHEHDPADPEHGAGDEHPPHEHDPADPEHGAGDEHPPHEHPPHEHHDHPPIGEVYVVAVHPDEQGRGLGPALTLTGLHHLRESGLASVLLYVDESNTTAVRVYERLGFTRHATDVMYASP